MKKKKKNYESNLYFLQNSEKFMIMPKLEPVEILDLLDSDSEQDIEMIAKTPVKKNNLKPKTRFFQRCEVDNTNGGYFIDCPLTHKSINLQQVAQYGWLN